MTKKILILGLVMSCVLFFSAVSPVLAADELETLNDDEGDVYVLNEESLDAESFSDMGITSDKPNLDIKSVVYSKEDGVKEVTVTFEVYGDIEDSGINYDLVDADDVNESDFSAMLDPIISYLVSINTSGQVYTITYNNEICEISRGGAYGVDLFGTYFGGDAENCTYEKDGPILTFTFDLDDADETFVQMSAQSMCYDISSLFLSDENSASIEIHIDMAPNPLTVTANGPTKGKTGKTLEFTGSASDGTYPYEYEWDFDEDGVIDSTEQNPTHSYSEDGVYSVTLTVSGIDGSVGADSFEIEISKDGGSGGDNDNSNNGLLIFIALILVVVIAGSAVLFYVLKR